MKVRFVRAFTFAPLLLAAVLLAFSAPGHAQSGKPRILGYFLTLEGEPMGWMDAVEGAGLDADVLPLDIADNGFLRKRPGNVKYQDIKMTCGSEMSKKFYDWIKASFDGKEAKYLRKSGELIAADFNYKAVSRIAFQGALITEVGMPALERGANVSARLFVRFQPDQRTLSGGGGQVNAPPFKRKNWLTGNFNIRIDGLEKACAQINKVNAIAFKQKVVAENGGELLIRDVCNFSLTLPTSDSDLFHQWFDASVVKGKTDERSATIEYLNANGAALFTLHLPQIGLFGESWVYPKAGEDTALRDVKCQCFCNGGWLEYSGH